MDPRSVRIFDGRYFFGGGAPGGGFMPGGPAVSGILMRSPFVTPDRTSTLMPSDRPSFRSRLRRSAPRSAR